jgi:hypothetical protein
MWQRQQAHHRSGAPAHPQFQAMTPLPPQTPPALRSLPPARRSVLRPTILLAHLLSTL